ncbi:MAG: hypothetical protein AB7D29_09690 [Campylobacterales bacterium]
MESDVRQRNEELKKATNEIDALKTDISSIGQKMQELQREASAEMEDDETKVLKYFLG